MTHFVCRKDIQSWGRTFRASHLVARPTFNDELPHLVERAGKPILAVGLMRSYGDSNLNPENAIILTEHLDRIRFFDVEAGVIRADAGLTLCQLIRVTLPQGWFPPVVPGTRFVTLGGAVANDVHGKNHHSAGTFGRHVRRLGILRSNGERRELSFEDSPALFSATIGGLGLTGIIEWVELTLRRTNSAFLTAETTAFKSLDEFYELSSGSESREHTAAWIDCTTKNHVRGLFSRGDFTTNGELGPPHPASPALRVPMDLPSFALNSVTLRLFNQGYYQFGRFKSGRRQVHYAPFFFPLDAIAQWNRLYGPRGFFQYQCVVPEPTAPDAIRRMLHEVAQSGEGSFLAVLKTFGALRSPGLLSFPLQGTTLALDFRNRGSATLKLLDRLDSILTEAGGRLYPAKDARMSAGMFRRGYSHALQEFATHVDPAFSSSFWRRVFR